MTALADDDYAELPLDDRPRRLRQRPAERGAGHDRLSRFDDFDSGSLAFSDPEEVANARGQQGGSRTRRNNALTSWQWLRQTTAGRWVFAASIVTGIAVLAIATYLVREFLRTDSRFRVASSDQVQVEGNRQVTADDLRGVFGEDIGRNLFFIPIRQRQHDTEALPWVEHASLERLLPNRIHVRVQERVPVAFAQSGDRILLIDHAGVLLETPSGPGTPQYSFPVVVGVGADIPASTRSPRMGQYLGFLKELDSHGEKISSRLSEVDINDPEDIQAVIPEGNATITLHLGYSDYYNRYQTYRTHLAEWQQQYPRLNKVDMQNSPQIVLGVGDGPPAATAESVAAKAPAISPAPKPAVISRPAANSKVIAASTARKKTPAAVAKKGKLVSLTNRIAPPVAAAKPVLSPAMQVFQSQSPRPVASIAPIPRNTSGPALAPARADATKPALHLHAPQSTGGQQ